MPAGSEATEEAAAAMAAWVAAEAALRSGCRLLPVISLPPNSSPPTHHPDSPHTQDGREGGLPPAGSGKPGGWVPPSLRNRVGGAEGESMQKRRDENSVRVSNLSEDVTEDDLAELFDRFGPIQRIFVAKDRETGACRACRVGCSAGLDL